MTFLNNNPAPTTSTTTTTTVLPDFQYLTSSSDEQPIATTSHIPVYPISKSEPYTTNNTPQVKTSLTSPNRSNRTQIIVFFSSKVIQSSPLPMNNFLNQQPITNIGRIMTGSS